MPGSGPQGRAGITFLARIADDSASAAVRAAAPSASAERSARLTVRLIPAISSSSAAAFANGTAVAACAVIDRSPGDSDACSVPSSRSRGTTPCPHWRQW